MKLSKCSIFLCVALTCGSANAGGIPVFDAAGLAQALQTVVQLKQQIDEIKGLRSQLEGIRNMGDLLNQPELRNYLPTDWKGVYDQVKNGGYKGLDGSFNAIEDAESVAGKSSEMAALKKRQWENSVANKSMGEAAYSAALKRLDNIESLGRQINATQDAKASMDLQARIQQEQALIQNETSRLQLISMLQQAEHNITIEKERQIQKNIWSSDKPMPRF
ncbi:MULTISPECIES: P-type DNA transfer protein VirB5 [Enterobacteriaceae]|uniref:P-type DNA transfer protein VirB5 n=1 Tax=Enterobacteriaceae TaxID=543 RepID=UPI000CAB0E82|nr:MULTISPECIES: P-type DNA transfer protein VirB5 [Enterobacteriaceae]EAN4566649.1 P-type DNA transfer protein VirB5 [Salmonella enterica subsp. enterica serovar Senftenberg]EAT0477562.1 P-type DNA transfer protein VirB5 [Salmonella enterica]EBG8282966.1 P-type DNA transfer protein VirB5 [Salmonella enterica subsp. enterica serovar Muenchen]EBX4631453.1 P-type DNA transfer protein VirB5 [Salmonella enterica subsp. enterica serovar Infantis]ECE8411182.1 P-type DNA transfer protein VirB5 [Salmo